MLLLEGLKELELEGGVGGAGRCLKGLAGEAGLSILLNKRDDFYPSFLAGPNLRGRRNKGGREGGRRDKRLIGIDHSISRRAPRTQFFM